MARRAAWCRADHIGRRSLGAIGLAARVHGRVRPRVAAGGEFALHIDIDAD